MNTNKLECLSLVVFDHAYKQQNLVKISLGTKTSVYLSRLRSTVCLRLYPQTLDLDNKVSYDKHSSLTVRIISYEEQISRVL
jgi:hypothetical protein